MKLPGLRNQLNRNPFQLDANPMHGHPESRADFNERLLVGCLEKFIQRRKHFIIFE